MPEILSGTTSLFGNLTGIITEEATITGTIKPDSGLYGNMSVSTASVPYYETSNDFGGTTVFIGREVINNGV